MNYPPYIAEKFEIRSTKHETNSKFEFINDPNISYNDDYLSHDLV